MDVMEAMCVDVEEAMDDIEMNCAHARKAASVIGWLVY